MEVAAACSRNIPYYTLECHAAPCTVPVQRVDLPRLDHLLFHDRT